MRAHKFKIVYNAHWHSAVPSTVILHKMAFLFVDAIAVAEAAQFALLRKSLRLQYLLVLAGVVQHVWGDDHAPLVSQQRSVRWQRRRRGRVLMREVQMRVRRHWRMSLVVQRRWIWEISIRHVIIGTISRGCRRWSTYIRRFRWNIHNWLNSLVIMSFRYSALEKFQLVKIGVNGLLSK